MKVKTLEIIGIFGVFLIGVFLYFAYDIFNQSQFIAMIAPVNRSLWELLKVPFYSVLFYGLIVQLFAKGEHNNIIFAKAFSAIVTSIFALMMHFGYTAFFDQHILLDTTAFFVAVVLGQFLCLGILNIRGHVTWINFLGILLLMTVSITFATYTYEPPNHELFHDTKTNSYGIPR